jgi:hypothetical protein
MTEKRVPQGRSHIEMEKEMVHGLLRLLAHAASVDHDNMAFPEIVQCDDPSKSHRPWKEGRHWGGLGPPHTLPGKASTYKTSQGVEKSLDLEKAIFGRDPPKLVLATSSNYHWMQYLEERAKTFTSQWCASLANSCSTSWNHPRTLGFIWNKGVLGSGYTKQGWKSCLKSHIPAKRAKS